MDTAQHAGFRANEIKGKLLGIRCDVRWSSRDSAHVAFGVEVLDPTRTDVWSPPPAIDGSGDKIRTTVKAEPNGP